MCVLYISIYLYYENYIYILYICVYYIYIYYKNYTLYIYIIYI